MSMKDEVKDVVVEGILEDVEAYDLEPMELGGLNIKKIIIGGVVVGVIIAGVVIMFRKKGSSKFENWMVGRLKKKGYVVQKIDDLDAKDDEFAEFNDVDIDS